jgi:MFS family permease
VEDDDPPATPEVYTPPRFAWRRLRHPLDFWLSRQLTRTITREQVHNLRVFWLDGIFAAGSDGLVLTYIPLFALAYGATAGQIGWITALANLAGAIALFPGAKLLEIVGKRKPIIVWGSAFLYRLPLLLMALIPLVIVQPTAALVTILILTSIRGFGVNLGNPSWTSLTADIVPEYMRGRYFSIRNFLMGIATLLTPPLAGWIIATLSSEALSPYLGYQVVFALGFAVGLVASYYFSRIHEPPFLARRTADKRSRRLWVVARNSPGLLGFIISAFVWNMALHTAGPYFNVYLVREMGADPAVVGVAAASSALAALVGQLFYGRLADRRGMVWVFLASGFPIATLPLLWLIYSAPWQVVVGNLLGGFLWAGFNLANFNLLLKLTPDDERPRTAALYQTAVFVSAVIGPLLGGYMVDALSYNAIFVASGAGRFTAMWLFVWLAMKSASATEPCAKGNE